MLAFTTRRAAHPAADVVRSVMPQLANANAALLKAVLGKVRLQRIGIAGGDTSSIAVRALDAWGLSYLAPLSAGVAVCRLRAERGELDGMEVMLKGGQMGDADLFEQLLNGYAGDEAADTSRS